MRTLKISCWTLLVVSALIAGGCAQHREAAVRDAALLPDPVRVETSELQASLVAMLVSGQAGTLLEDPGLREFIFDIENVSGGPLTVRTVKMLNADGRFFDSAASYGQIIPFGSLITTAFFSAASAMSAGETTNSRQAFNLRVLKNVKLAPAGKIRGSAFLPGIANAELLILEYAQAGRVTRIEIPLAFKAP